MSEIITKGDFVASEVKRRIEQSSIFLPFLTPFVIRTGTTAIIPKETKRKTYGLTANYVTGDIKKIEEQSRILLDFKSYSTAVISPYKVSLTANIKEDIDEAQEQAIELFYNKFLDIVERDCEIVFKSGVKIIKTKKDISYKQIEKAANKIEKKSGDIVAFHVLVNPSIKQNLRLCNVKTSSIIPENVAYVVGIPNCTGAAFAPIGYFVTREKSPVCSVEQNLGTQSYNYTFSMYYSPIIVYPEAIIRIERSKVD